MARLDVYTYMMEHQEHLGFPPTLNEIAAACDYSHRSGARRAMQALVRAGLVIEAKEPHRARRYEAVHEGEGGPTGSLPHAAEDPVLPRYSD